LGQVIGSKTEEISFFSKFVSVILIAMLLATEVEVAMTVVF